jgi:GDP-D-mannose dehydratase
LNVLLVGITGQTAAYVTKFLLELGFEVTGSSRDKARANLSNLQRVGVNTSKLCIISLDPADPRQVFCVLANSSYDIIINLAGQTSVGLSFDQPAQSLDLIITSCLNFIEAIKSLKLKPFILMLQVVNVLEILMTYLQVNKHPLSPIALMQLLRHHPFILLV